MGAASAHDETGAPGLGARAASAGRAMAGKLAPALAGMSTRAKGAAGNDDGSHPAPPRRAGRGAEGRGTRGGRPRRPAPGGAITNEGRRLVRDDGMDEDEEAAGLPPAATNSGCAAAIGGALEPARGAGDSSGMTRLVGSRGQDGEKRRRGEREPRRRRVAGAPRRPPRAARRRASPTANVPLFGATPLL